MQNNTYKKISFNELNRILMNHRQWLESSGTRGQRAEFNGIDLSNRDLFGAILTRAIIEDVDLCGANLRTANLQEANIRKCRFSQAHFQWSILAGAVIDIMQKVGMPNGLRAVGYEPADVDKMVEATRLQHRVTKISPRPASAEDLKQLFLDSMEIW